MARRDDAQASRSPATERRGRRALRRVARYALIGLAISVAGVLVAAPFQEQDVFAKSLLTQRAALAHTVDSTTFAPDGDGRRFIGIEGTYVKSRPWEGGMPWALESLLLSLDDGSYHVWWSGFPFRSVCGWHVEAGALRNGGPPADIWHGVVRIPIAPPHFFVFLPFRPLWLGLLGNAAVYGLTVFLAVQAFGAWRRAYRRENGKCIGCGYELAGLEGCPECGRGAVAAGVRE